MSKENRRKIEATVIGAVALLFIVVGVSFAVFNVSLFGAKTQNMSNGCLKVEMSDNGSVSLDS